MARGFLLLASVAFAAADFSSDFSTSLEESAWSPSSDAKFAEGKWEVGAGTNTARVEGEQVLIVKEAAKHHAISAKFDAPIDPKENGIVVQYEVRFAKNHVCGGAYLKVLKEDAEFTPASFKDDSPYIIMFGPDKCGATDKVHFIFRHKSPVTGKFEEKHLVSPPGIKNDLKTHLYTLAVKADDTYEIFIDQKSVKSGMLHEDFEPAVNPPKEIDDPEDKKPEDWVDEQMMDDPEDHKPEDWDEEAPRTIPDAEAVKPEGWGDDEEEMIPDPEASIPDDWDEEDDGEWEAPQVPNPICVNIGCGTWERPMIPNPDYKGKWYAKQIEHPNWKGIWKAVQIPNPEYFDDKSPHALTPMGAVGIEIWTMQDGIEFDNVYVGTSLDTANEKAATWVAKKEAEQAADPDPAPSAALESVTNLVTDNPIASVSVLVAIIALFLYICDCFSAREVGIAEVPVVTRKEGTEEEEEEAAAADEEEEGEEEEEEAEKPMTPRRSLRNRKKAD